MVLGDFNHGHDVVVREVKEWSVALEEVLPTGSLRIASPLLVTSIYTYR